MAYTTEGIDLLSMYNDEDEEEEEEEEHQHNQQQQHQQEDRGRSRIDHEADDAVHDSIPESLPDSFPSKSPQALSSPSPEVKALRSPTHPPLPKSQRSSPLSLASHSPTRTIPPRPPPPPEAVDVQKGRRGALEIVDYAHDEAAMSPEAEEGDIVSSGRVVIGTEIQNAEGNFEERTPPGTVQLLAPINQPEDPQPSDIPEQSRSETSLAIDSIGTGTEIVQVEVVAVVSEEVQDDPLKSFLPHVTTKCSEELQEKINTFFAYMKAGKSFNADLRIRKDYRNPDFLQHVVCYQHIDQMGTCFSKDVFDPHGYDKSDYYDEIEADMKCEMERREHERKKSQKVEFVPGGMQTSAVATALKIPAAVTSGSVSSIPDANREIRQNKKSKWDEIDGDAKNPVPSSGHDNHSAVGVNAAHLSAANAGSGYTAFA